MKDEKFIVPESMGKLVKEGHLGRKNRKRFFMIDLKERS